MFAIGVRVPQMFCRADNHGDGSYTLWLYDTGVTSWATADYEPGRRAAYEVVQSGPRRLWDDLEAWEQQGKPGFESFELAVNADGEQRIHLGEESWAV
ncbi:MAG TPA: hypothetical protein DEQ61_22980 [Streptomyces sp.]|nr:hypothetical protein [Streptomyces sp.]